MCVHVKSERAYLCMHVCSSACMPLLCVCACVHFLYKSVSKTGIPTDSSLLQHGKTKVKITRIKC